METLLSLTSKRAGDWFKEELRLLGGLDHIVDKGSRYYKGLVLTQNKIRQWCIWFLILFPCFYAPSTVKECVDNLNQEDDEEKLVSSLWGAERCLRVLESVSVADFTEVWENLKIRSDHRLDSVFPLLSKGPDDKTNYSADVWKSDIFTHKFCTHPKWSIAAVPSWFV